MTRIGTHTIHEYPPDRLTFADLVTAKLPLAQNAADIVALINAYKVPFVQIQEHITIIPSLNLDPPELELLNKPELLDPSF